MKSAPMMSLRALLGDDGNVEPDELRGVLSVRVAAGAEQASDVYASFRHSDGHTFGTTRWRFTQGEVCEGVLALPGARLLTSGSLKVSLLPVSATRSVLIYPLCLGNEEVDLDGYVKIRQSALRRLLFTPSAQQERGFQLAFKLFEPALSISAEDTPGSDGVEDEIATAEDAAAHDIEAEMGAQPEVPATLIVCHTSTPFAGSKQIFIGEAEMTLDGSLQFRWYEQLPVPSVASSALPRPVHGMSERAGTTPSTPFGSVPEPSYDLEVLAEEQPPTPSGDDDASAGDDDAMTGDDA